MAEFLSEVEEYEDAVDEEPAVEEVEEPEIRDDEEEEEEEDNDEDEDDERTTEITTESIYNGIDNSRTSKQSKIFENLFEI